MQTLINEVYEIIKDYRSDETVTVGQAPKMSIERIRRWINQFDANDQVFILTELKNIFEKHYCSKEDIRGFLKVVVDGLTKDFGYEKPQDFLKNVSFLDLQSIGESQKEILEILREVLWSHYRFNLHDCGSLQEKHFIYIDDMLCTGNTLFGNISAWCTKERSPNQSYLQAMKEKVIDLTFVYVFVHIKNYQKKCWEIEKRIDSFLTFNHKLYCAVEIDNTVYQSSNSGVIHPLEEGQSAAITAYKDKIVNKVDQHNISRGYNIASEEFYRQIDSSTEEKFFTSSDNRKRFENTILERSLKILDSSKYPNRDPTLRALGHSLPSHKNFGFGALCFTWRRASTNTPLAFWYEGGNYPLFA